MSLGLNHFSEGPPPPMNKPGLINRGSTLLHGFGLHYFAGVTILTVSRGYRSPKLGLFLLPYHLGGGFDNGKITRSVFGKLGPYCCITEVVISHILCMVLEGDSPKGKPYGNSRGSVFFIPAYLTSKPEATWRLASPCLHSRCLAAGDGAAAERGRPRAEAIPHLARALEPMRTGSPRKTFHLLQSFA